MTRRRGGAAVLGALAVLVCAPGAGATAPYLPKRPPLLTPWTESVSTTLPLPEYPRPQLERADWLNLNGRWQYQSAARGQPPPFGHRLAETVLVPFPVESPLSGIERSDQAGWYRRTFRVPAQWSKQHVLLNFGAVSWIARVYVNRRLAGTHRGDYDAFSCDITRLLRPGSNELLVAYDDPVGSAGEPVGKQVPGLPFAFYHSASSGIWQTVWLEPVARAHVTGVDLQPDVTRGRLLVTANTVAAPAGATVIAEALDGRRPVARATGTPGRAFALPIPHARLWSPADPFLYGLRIRLASGSTVEDRVQSYFGMRSISLGRVAGAVRILLNGHFLFESGALDQGYWPDGLYTPPTDAALRFDLTSAHALGYDMVRMHAKVEADRWYYWADKLGMLVWQDMPNMPIAGVTTAPTAGARAEFRRELSAIVLQHVSHPSIVVWVPFNEGWGQFDLDGITRLVKQLDPTRLVDTQSGSANCCDAVESSRSDVRDSHLYFGPFAVAPDRRATVIGEYGGVLPYPPVADRWPGLPTSIGAPAGDWPLAGVVSLLRAQYAELALEMRVGGLSGAVFTELGANEQELGIVSYDRRVFTVPPSLLRSLNDSLIRASARVAAMRPPAAVVPPGTTGLWHFDERHGVSAADASGGGQPLTLTGGAGWTHGVHGTALAITAAGEQAATTGPVVDTRRSFTISTWLSSGRAHQSGTAVSEPGTAGSVFSLGIATNGPSPGERAGSVALGRPPRPLRTWWTLTVPSGTDCPASSCGIHASMHYDDGRYSPVAGTWHYVAGVYDAPNATATIYVDGIPEDVEHVFGLPPASGPLTVGTGVSDYAPTDNFVGAIDELRTYARALSPAEVYALYRAQARGAAGVR